MLRGAFVRVAAALAVIAAGLVVAPQLSNAAVNAASTWTTTASPNVPGTPAASLSAIGCADATTCFAVGSSSSALGRATLIERWNGTSFNVVNNADPIGALDAQLSGIACATATNCFAGGSYKTAAGLTRVLIEQWNGTVWSVVSVPLPAGAQVSRLRGLACADTTRCFAVGEVRIGGTLKTLIETWNGTSWSVASSPSPGTSTNANSLAAVSCGSASSCFAVGSHVDSARKPLIERWDGTDWSVVASPIPIGAEASELLGVACPSETTCFAVGSWGGSAYRTLIERWDGANWSVVANPSPSSASFPPYLAGVTCTSDTSCFAVGAFTPNQSRTPLIKQWNGTTWSDITGPSQGSASQLLGVACATATSCVTVGDQFDASIASRVTLVDIWSGTSWSTVASPTPGPPINSLAAVTCRSASNCFAVGERFPSLVDDPSASLIERWNGASWVVQQTFDARPQNHLAGVACPSDTRCFAVGYEKDTDFAARLRVAQWNGTTWSNLVVNAFDGTQASQLDAVACASATRCFAVGRYRVHSKFMGLVERWSGTNWTPMDSPDSSKMTFAALNGIACPTATSCFAVGEQIIDGAHRTLIEQWTGQGWTKALSPTPAGATRSELLAVACSSATSCVAVGTYDAGGVTRAFVERWNGTSWSMTTGLGPAGASAVGLSGVSCPGASNCYAVGSSTTGSVTTPLILQFNGTNWSIQSSAAPSGATTTALSAVSCTSATNCFAVGDSERKNARTTFIQRSS